MQDERPRCLGRSLMYLQGELKFKQRKTLPEAARPEGLHTGNRKQVSDDIDSLMSLSCLCILPIWAPFTLGHGCVICLPYVLRGNCLFNGKTISIVPCQTPPRALWWMAPACSLLWERCTLLTGDCSLSPNLSARFNKFIFLNQTLLAELCQKWINQAGELQRGIILSRGLSSW